MEGKWKAFFSVTNSLWKESAEQKCMQLTLQGESSSLFNAWLGWTLDTSTSSVVAVILSDSVNGQESRLGEG